MLGKLIEKVADIAVENASFAFLYEPEIPNELLEQKIAQADYEQEEQ